MNRNETKMKKQPQLNHGGLSAALCHIELWVNFATVVMTKVIIVN